MTETSPLRYANDGMARDPHSGALGLGRIPEIDGLRAVAVLGVLFAHVWAFGCGNVGLVIAGFDVNRALSVLGTGVDLFFVISGFCIYLAYLSTGEALTLNSYLSFLRKRARRIYPAYAAAVFVAAVIWTVTYGAFPTLQVALHLLFAQTLTPDGNQLAAPFWSLATEWHFYLILPLLIAAARTFGYATALLTAGCCCIVYRMIESADPPVSDCSLLSRLIEFLIGIVVARLYLEKIKLPLLFRGVMGFAIGSLIMLAGRALMMDSVVNSVMRPLVLAFNTTVLATGYGIILWNVIASDSVPATALRSRPMQWLGRVSYSFYLWHWFPAVWIGAAVSDSMGGSPLAPLIASVIAICVVSAVAWLSYVLCEAPYFSRRQQNATT